MSHVLDLNPIQQEAVKHTHGPVLILAGAGSGKTRVLTHRVAYLLEQKIASPEEILLLTFTNKASGEMMHRVEALTGGKVKVMGGTFHSFCVRVLRRYAQEAGLDPNFVIFDTDDQLDVVKTAMMNLGIDAKTNKPSTFLNTISGAKNELISADEYASFARGDWQQKAARIYMAYQQLLARYKAVDFDDLLVRGVKMLQNNDEVRDKLQEQFKHVLVDEYQDTNKAQYMLTKILAGKHKNITVVGDAAQAIYSWRGADYKNMLLLKSDFADLVTINLEQNYRSTQNILSAANSVISQNKKHPILKLWTDNTDGDKITVYEADTEADEARFVADTVWNKNYADFAVLYRTNAQSRVFEEALLHRGIPYTLIGGVRFYERREIKDVMAYLHLLVNPDNEVARKRCEKNGKGRLAKLVARSSWFVEKRATIDIVDEVLKVTGYLEQYDPENEEDASRLENIKELRSVAEQFPDLLEFLENVALTEKESKRVNFGDQGAVTLMTLHAAKGLEFKNVFLVGMEEGLFPHSRSLMDAEQMEEERRLAYVGITRAMKKLYLSYARRRLYFGQRGNNPVSRFLAEIPERLIENKTSGLGSLGEYRTSPTSRRSSAASIGARWGFDENGNWQWKPDDADA